MPDTYTLVLSALAPLSAPTLVFTEPMDTMTALCCTDAEWNIDVLIQISIDSVNTNVGADSGASAASVSVCTDSVNTNVGADRGASALSTSVYVSGKIEI